MLLLALGVGKATARADTTGQYRWDDNADIVTARLRGFGDPQRRGRSIWPLRDVTRAVITIGPAA